MCTLEPVKGKFMNNFLFHAITAMSAFLTVFYLIFLSKKNQQNTRMVFLLGIAMISLYLVLVLGLNQLNELLRDMVAQFVFLAALTLQFFGLRHLKSSDNKSSDNLASQQSGKETQ